MRIGLFIPCYIDAFFPEVGIATLELLERFSHDVHYPRDQTCCGQPMANSGFNAECANTEALFVRNFSGFDYVVSPSGSCVHHVRDNFDAIEQTDEVKEVRARTFELVEFLHDILKVDAFPWARFPHRVGLHNSCGTLRRLKHAAPPDWAWRNSGPRSNASAAAPCCRSRGQPQPDPVNLGNGDANA